MVDDVESRRRRGLQRCNGETEAGISTSFFTPLKKRSLRSLNLTSSQNGHSRDLAVWFSTKKKGTNKRDKFL